MTRNHREKKVLHDKQVMEHGNGMKLTIDAFLMLMLLHIQTLKIGM